jgi:hypothetical protein
MKTAANHGPQDPSLSEHWSKKSVQVSHTVRTGTLLTPAEKISGTHNAWMGVYEDDIPVLWHLGEPLKRERGHINHMYHGSHASKGSWSFE